LLLNDLDTFADGKIGAQLALNLARGEIGFGPHRLAGIAAERNTLLTKAAC
jgi:hypothetical protein